MAGDQSFRLALAAVLALAGIGSVAQTAPQEPGTAPTSLTQAIRIAEQETGGRARAAEFERDEGVDVYEIKTVARDRSATVVIDLLSGTVVRVEGPGFLSSLLDRDDQREDQAELARLEASPMTLLDAVGAAERETGGRAVEASLTSQFGQTLFRVLVVRDLVQQRVLIDPTTGKVVTLPESRRRNGR